jgi:hypothetical protein
MGVTALRSCTLVATLVLTATVTVSGCSALATKLSNWAAWQTTLVGMTFHFGDHQFGGHGLRHYTIPWSQAKLVLSEYGENLLGPR